MAAASGFGGHQVGQRGEHPGRVFGLPVQQGDRPTALEVENGMQLSCYVKAVQAQVVGLPAGAEPGREMPEAGPVHLLDEAAEPADLGFARLAGQVPPAGSGPGQVDPRGSDRGLVISAGKMSGLWSGEPNVVKLRDLDVICAVLGCGVEELLIPEPGTVTAPRPAAEDAPTAAVGARAAVVPRAQSGRSLPPR